MMGGVFQSSPLGENSSSVHKRVAEHFGALLEPPTIVRQDPYRIYLVGGGLGSLPHDFHALGRLF